MDRFPSQRPQSSPRWGNRNGWLAQPKLRELVARLPADRIALVAISADKELETVTRFIEDEPMPWTNWHAGLESDFECFLCIETYPTYMLANENGTILARTGSLDSSFISLIENAVDQLGGFGSTKGLDVYFKFEDFRKTSLPG